MEIFGGVLDSNPAYYSEFSVVFSPVAYATGFPSFPGAPYTLNIYKGKVNIARNSRSSLTCVFWGVLGGNLVECARQEDSVRLPTVKKNLDRGWKVIRRVPLKIPYRSG